MTTETQGAIIEVSRLKENIQSPNSAPVIITSGYMLNANGERVEAIFKNATTGAAMSNMEVPAEGALKFDLSKPIDAHNYEILKLKVEAFPRTYGRILKITDLREKSQHEVESKERALLIQAKVPAMKEIEVIELCRYLQFVRQGKTVTDLKRELYQYIEANPEVVAAAMEDEKLPIKAIINDAINRKLIVKSDTGAYMREATKLIYGSTFDDIVDYFSNNQEAISELMHQKQQEKEPIVQVTLNTVAAHNMEELFEGAKKAGVILKDSKQYTYNDIPLGTNKEVCIEFLKNNPNIAQTINDVVNKK